MLSHTWDDAMDPYLDSTNNAPKKTPKKHTKNLAFANWTPRRHVVRKCYEEGGRKAFALLSKHWDLHCKPERGAHGLQGSHSISFSMSLALHSTEKYLDIWALRDIRLT